MPALLEARQRALDGPQAALQQSTAVDEARVGDGGHGKGECRHEQPPARPARRREGADAEPERGEGEDQARRGEPGVGPVAGGQFRRQQPPPLEAGGGYGRTIPSAVHRYNVRRWLPLSVKVSTFSGVQSPKPKLCATIRVPGLRARVSIGRSFRFEEVSR